jgi:hypothetical protein
MDAPLTQVNPDRHISLNQESLIQGRGRCLVRVRIVRRPATKITWWIRAPWLIRCTIVPLIHRQARINHRKVKVAALVSE